MEKQKRPTVESLECQSEELDHSWQPLGSRDILEQERSRAHGGLFAGNRRDYGREISLSGWRCLRLLVLLYEAGGEEDQTFSSGRIPVLHSLHSRAG